MNHPDIFNALRVDSRTAVVTGGNRGLGRAIADALAQAGANVVILSTKEHEAAAVAKELSDKYGTKSLGVGADQGKIDQVDAAIDRIEKEFGHADILVNNAAIIDRTPTVDLDMETWHRVIDVDLTGPFRLTQRLGAKMLDNGWGRVCMVTSLWGHRGFPSRAPYSAAKGALSGMMRSLVVEWAKQGVTINEIAPGPFSTDLNKVHVGNEKSESALFSKMPLARWGDPTEVAAIALYFCSNASSFTTGQTIIVDGGWSS